MGENGFRTGKIYSWIVLNDNTVIKICDKSFFEHKGTGVPKELKWFFSVDDLQHGDQKYVQLVYCGDEYTGKIEIHKLGQCRLFWRTNLCEIFIKHYHEGTDSFPLIRFQRIDESRYEIEFIDESLLDEEKEDPYETIVSMLEGKRVEYYGTKYERNPINRKKAIEIHGLRCMICGFDFEQFYGEAGRNLIEVHHIKPLSQIGEEVVVNPETDLVCICANCHRIIHRRRDKVYSVEEVKRMINKPLRE